MLPCNIDVLIITLLYVYYMYLFHPINVCNLTWYTYDLLEDWKTKR